ncbi:hypothetical protein BH11BAC7_BH11BAC7_02630 [soil metagenome]
MHSTPILFCICFVVTVIGMLGRFILFRKVKKEFGFDFTTTRVYPSTITKLINDNSIAFNSRAHHLIKAGMIFGFSKYLFFVGWIYMVLAILRLVPY